jgi:hypothetical protein
MCVQQFLNYVILYCIVCQIVINADSSTLGSLLGLNTHVVMFSSN